MLRTVRIVMLMTAFTAAGFVPGGAPRAQTTALVNGSFVTTPAPWMLPGDSDQLYEAVQGWYGYAPSIAPWTPNVLVFPFPFPYQDILDGAEPMAKTLNQLGSGDLNVITHSHGGNVVIGATYQQIWSRTLRRLINLGTPINWDLAGVTAVPVGGRCQISSTADWVQFIGASPYQIANFAYAIYSAISGAVEAFQAAIMGDYLTAMAYFQYAVFEVIVAEYWWLTTKVEVVGPTYMFSGLSHSDLHTGPVWFAIAPYCA